MLHTTLATDFMPGTNLTGGLARASWRFLLPNLELDNILCLGVPSIEMLSVLSAMSAGTVVVSTNASRVEAAERERQRQAIPNVKTTRVADWHRLPLADKSVSLVVITAKKDLATILRDISLPEALCRVLKDDGVIYFEIGKVSHRSVARRMIKRLINLGFAKPRWLWLTPFNGELRTAFPLDDDRMARYLFTNVLYGQSVKKRAASRTGVMLSQMRLLRSLLPRRAVLLQRSSRCGDGQAPPEYMIALAKQAGLELSDLQCGLSARGKFNANKNIFYLFDRDSSKAQAVVKMTRAAEFNQRLENEYRVLTLLHKQRFVAPGTYPEPLFFGYHAKLALLGQRAVYGEPFRSRTKATVDCPIAHDAIAWIVQLGAASSNKSAVTAVHAAEALMKLYRRFAEIYPLSPAESDFLVTQIKTMSRIPEQFPVVFQHGDPGTWNMLVSEQNKVIVIDWEAGEPEGMPLWDLLYFMRTYGSWIARMQGMHDSLQSFTKQFVEPSALGTLLVETVERYCKQVGLAGNWIEPLFYTCWMHRALKESTRLAPAALPSGHYFNLLRRSIERREAAGLTALFSVQGSEHSKAPSMTRLSANEKRVSEASMI